MGNIKNYNFNKIDAFLSNSEYYDFYLAQDGICDYIPARGILGNACLTLHFDFKNSDIYTSGGTYGNTVKSLVTWENAVNDGFTFETFGLTGIDNGLITFNKLSADTSNNELTSTLTGSTVIIPSGDTRFTFNTVTGMTGNYVYPKYINNDTTSVGDHSTFCGGFYQGYFKLDGYNYEVLPTRSNKGWVAEFWLNKSELMCSGFTGTTLNDTHPDNKGFFFYMGTRAENKFWNFFEGNNTGCTTECISDSGCADSVTKFCTVTKETEISISGDSGYPVTLHPPTYRVETVDNPFLIYGRATKNDGKCGKCGHDNNPFGKETVCTYSGGGITFTSDTQTSDYETNPFLIYGRATKNRNSGGKCGGCGFEDDFGKDTICTYTGGTDKDYTLDVDLDVIDNAIRFRIRDDGSIGYRLLTITGFCSDDKYITGVTMEEGYSISGVVTEDTWEHIVIRFITSEEYNECELKIKGPRLGRLMFYIGGNLKYVVDDFDEIIFRRLNEYKDKQLGVPFNYSLGGGSQGLLETMTFDGQDSEDLGLNIEKYFAGTFIGSISQFKFYNCDLNWCDIKNNYKSEFYRYLLLNK